MPFGRDPNKYTPLVFWDEFDGSQLDRSKWNDAIWYQSSHPTINYAVENGSLKIWPVAPFVDRTIDTDNKYYQQGGYFEIDAKLPRGRGCWPAFWLLGHPDDRRPEIDIMEAYPGGGTTSSWGDANLNAVNYAVTTWHTNGAQAGFTMMDWFMPSQNLSASFHKYAVEWDSQGCTYYFDGQQLGPKHLSTRIWLPLYILLDLWFGGPSGVPNTTETPQGKANNSYEVRYVRAWQFK